MNWKRGMFTVLAATMLAGISLAGCSSGGSQKSSVNGQATKPTNSNFNKTGLPIVKKKLTLTIAGQYCNTCNSADWNKKSIFQTLEGKTNIHINWQLTPISGWQQKKNLLIASGNLPDVLLSLTPSDIAKYGPQGVFIPLEGLINKYAPHLKKELEQYPAVKKAITAPDGHIYSLPRVRLTDSSKVGVDLWIDKKWLDKLGLKMPKTTKQFKQVLEAFKNKDPNGNGKHDEIPFLWLYDAQSPNYLNGVCKAFGVMSPNVLVKNGKVIYPLAQPGYKRCIQYFHSLLTQGLINKTSFTITWGQYLAQLASGKKATVGVFYGAGPGGDVGNPKYAGDYVPVPPLQGPKGNRIVPKPLIGIDPSALAITSADKHPAATMRWIDQAYTPKMSLMIKQGPNRLKKLDNGKYKFVPHPANLSAAEWNNKESPANMFVSFYTQKLDDKVIYPKKSGLAPTTVSVAWYKKYREPYEKDVLYPHVMFTADESNKLSQYQTDIQKYTTKMTAQWIAHGGVEKGWSAYIKQLNSMGLKKMLKVYQKALNRYKSQ